MAVAVMLWCVYILDSQAASLIFFHYGCQCVDAYWPLLEPHHLQR